MKNMNFRAPRCVIFSVILLHYPQHIAPKYLHFIFFLLRADLLFHILYVNSIGTAASHFYGGYAWGTKYGSADF
jgi:hypothetical protein